MNVVPETTPAFLVYKSMHKIKDSTSKNKAKKRKLPSPKHAALEVPSKKTKNKQNKEKLGLNGVENGKKHQNKKDKIVNGKNRGEKRPKQEAVQSPKPVQTTKENAVKPASVLPILTEKKRNKRPKKKQSEENVPILVPIQKPLKNDLPHSLSNDSIVSLKKHFLSTLNETSDDDPMSEGFALFQWLISPVKPADFLTKHWETSHLHVSRGKPKYYSHVLSSSDLDKIFRDNLLHYGRNVDVVSYEDGQKNVHNGEGRAVPAALWDFYSNGCSIRILNPQTYSKKVHLLITTLQEYLGSMVGANVYLTPPGSQGFAPHYDDIEAFIIQLEGKKNWKLYQPTGSDVLARESSPNLKPENLGPPMAEICLEAGDLLYFPRGTIHEGRTDPDSHSLHITVSVYQRNSFADLLEIALPQALKKAANMDVAFRKGLPFHFLQHLGEPNKHNQKNLIRNSVLESVELLMANLGSYLDVDGAVDELGRRLVRDSMPPLISSSEITRSVQGDGDFLENGAVHNRVEMDPETKVRLVRYHAIRLVKHPLDEGVTNPRLYYATENSNIYHGEEEQFLELEMIHVPVVLALQRAYPHYVSIDTLPKCAESAEYTFNLCYQLWEHGILVTETPLVSFDDGSLEEIEIGSDFVDSDSE